MTELTLISEEMLDREVDYEALHPITTTWAFKGKKPIAVVFGEERIAVDTWKASVQVIFEKILADPEVKQKVLDLRDKVLRTKTQSTVGFFG